MNRDIKGLTLAISLGSIITQRYVLEALGSVSSKINVYIGTGVSDLLSVHLQLQRYVERGKEDEAEAAKKALSEKMAPPKFPLAAKTSKKCAVTFQLAGLPVSWICTSECHTCPSLHNALKYV